MARSALETGTLDLEGRGLASLSPGLFEDARALSAVTRAKLKGNKLKVCRAGTIGRPRFVFLLYSFFCGWDVRRRMLAWSASLGLAFDTRET